MRSLIKTKVFGYAMCVAMVVCGGGMAAEKRAVLVSEARS